MRLRDMEPTDPDVGPGSYALDPGYVTRKYAPAPAYAPFGSTTSRGMGHSKPPPGTVPTLDVPGPGSYETQRDPPLPGSPRRGARAGQRPPPGQRANAFNSSEGIGRRPHETWMDAPGPGQYAESQRDVWLKERYKPQAPPPSAAEERVVSAPSVPTRHQSYGFEVDAKTGALLPQRGPAEMHDGVKQTVGPGQYTPSDMLGRQQARAAGFAKGSNRVSAAEEEARRRSEMPGPGAYVPEGVISIERQTAAVRQVAGPGGSLVVNAARPNASFASRVDRFGPRELTDRVVGPGTYDTTPALGAFNKVHRGLRPAEQQNFGSSVRRPYEFDKTKLRHAPTMLHSPGPGAYEERRTISAGDFGVRARQAARSAKGDVPFTSTTMRFAQPVLQATHVPGPGAHQHQSYGTVASAVQARLSSKNGAFASSSSRFDTRVGWERQTPAPGAYEADPAMTERKAQHARKATSGFKSASDRFRDRRLVEASRLPGPGSHEIKVGWIKESVRAKVAPGGREVFLSTKDRFPRDEVAGGIRVVPNPGPGQYDDLHGREVGARPVMRHVQHGVFLASAPRFQPAEPARVRSEDAVRGPGSYEVNDPHNFNKRSFNATVS